MAISKYLAELIGTFVLVTLGTMSIIAGQAAGVPALLVVPFGFGLGLLVALYAIGHVSGGHYNPAVTLAMWLDRRISGSDLIGYWIGQAVGAVLASATLLIMTNQDAVATTVTGFDFARAGLVAEIVLTLVFVLAVLSSTRGHPRAVPFVASLALAGVHFAGLPFSGASVNPARSLGPALIGTDFVGFWVYVVGPFAGGALAWVIHQVFPTEAEEASPEP